MRIIEGFGRRLLNKLRTSVGSDRAALAPPPQVVREEVLTALEAARTGDSVAVDRLSLVLIDLDRRGDADLARWALGLLSGSAPSLWKNLDLAARRTWWDTPAWASAARDRISQGDPGTLALVVASFHPIGYVREAAAARLGEVNDPVALPALALRATDWVPEVRARTRAALNRRMSSSVETLLAVGPLAVMFADREQGSWLFIHLQQYAAGLDDSDLRRLLAAPDWRLRRTAYAIALRDRRLGRNQLLDAAAHDGDLIIRVECAEQAIGDAAAAGEVDEVQALTGSKTAAVRAAAVSALARAGHLEVAVAALADRNPVVREIAQTAVRRTGSDPAPRYRDMVGACDPADPAALAGLGETGVKTDARLVMPSLQHPLPRGRVEAVRALRRLGSVDVPVLVCMLDDQSAAVVRQVVATLAPYAGDIGAEQLTALLDGKRQQHVRTAAYRLLRAQNVWTRLATDLALYDDTEPSLRTQARGDLSGWLDREAPTAYAMPTGQTARRLDLLLRAAAPSLGSHRVRLLRFHLGLSDPAT